MNIIVFEFIKINIVTLITKILKSFFNLKKTKI
jgi:hypothetical protein